MKQHGKALAESHTFGLAGDPDQLLKRLAENEGILIAACDLLTAAVSGSIIEFRISNGTFRPFELYYGA